MEMFTGQALDAAATLALAKGALLKVQILEQLVLLGGLGANGELQAFSADMVRKLEVRRGPGPVGHWAGESKGTGGALEER